MNKSLYALLLITCLTSCRHKAGPPLPAFNLLLIDSTTVLSSGSIPGGNPFVLVYFSPDCEHCQAETAGILRKIDSLKNVRFYFITLDPFDRLKVFQDHYHLVRYPNVILGRDYQFSFVNHFKPTGTPCVLIYNSHKELRAVYNGGTDAGNIIVMTKNI